MRSLVLIYNKDERAMARNSLRDLQGLTTISDMESAMAEIEKPSLINLLVIDERLNDFNLAGNRNNLKVSDIIEKATESPERTPPVIAVILENDDVQTKQVEYSDLGVDAFITRPLGSKSFQDKMKEVAEWTIKPPALLKLRKTIRLMMAKGEYDAALPTLQKIVQTQADELSFSILLARCMLNSQAVTASETAEFIQKVTDQHPSCLPIQKLLVEALLSQGKVEEAFEAALVVFQQQQTALSLEKCLKIAADLNIQYNSILPYTRILLEFNPTHANANKETRSNVFKTMLSMLTEKRDLIHLNNALENAKDIQVTFLPELMELFTRFELSKIEDVDSEHMDISISLAERILSIEPGCPACIESYINVLIDRKDFKRANSMLAAAEKAKKLSAEFYASKARLAFAEGFLKEASDAIAYGRRMRPSDDRWEPLAQRWKEEYAKSQK